MYFNAVCLDDMVNWDGAKALVTGSLTEAGDATEDFDKDWGGLLVSLLSRDGWGWREARERLAVTVRQTRSAAGEAEEALWGGPQGEAAAVGGGWQGRRARRRSRGLWALGS